ncbi:hypothetical protein GCM10027085_49390 [Spirosoma aerophilum]
MAQQPNTISPQRTPSKAADSLRTKRNMFFTAVYQDTVRLSYSAVHTLYKDKFTSARKLEWAQRLKPVGPILILSGIVMGYLGLRGEQKTDYIRGIGTREQPNVPDVPASYVQRSLPKTLLGVGLLAGGIGMIEWANDCMASSVRLYNAKPATVRKVAHVDHINLGLTVSGNACVAVHF